MESALDPGDPGVRPSLRQALTLDNAERLLGAGLALCAVALHIRFFLHAGGLWRDEVQIVNLANTWPLSRWWELNEHDTFPVVWQALIRLWTALGPGRSDAGLRALGAGVGLATVGALFFAARRLGGRAPLLGLALFALSPMVLRYGDSLRGYGAGALTLLLLIGAISQLVLAPGRRALALGLCAALLAVHTMHFNAVVLLGLGGAAVALAALRRTLRPAATVIAVGAVAAVSILPYADPILRQRRWSEVVMRADPSLQLYLERFAMAADESGAGLAWVWLALLCLSLGACVYAYAAWGRGASGPGAAARERAVFIGAFLGAGVAGYVGFLFSSKLPTMPWYYMALMGLLAVGFDAAFSLFGDGVSAPLRRAARLTRLLLALVLAASALPRGWRAMESRMTLIDTAAAVLTRQAGPRDLIVICPFWYGITFQRYYHGSAPVLTVPMVPELDVQRFDLVRDEMAKSDPLGPLLARVAQTLQAGHRVFALGNLPALGPGEMPGALPPDTRYAALYTVLWTQQLSFLLQQHGAQIGLMSIGDPERTFEHERPNLLMVKGWR